MPTIPDIPNSSVNLQALPSNPRVNTPIIQQQSALQPLADAVHKMRQMFDQARVAEATNQLEQSRMQLTQEYSTQLGANVLPQDGEAFSDRYVGRLKESASDIALKLTPAQQELFNQQATVLGLQFQRSVEQHETEQLYKHAVGSHDNTIKLALQDASTSYKDPGTLGLLQGRIDGAVENLAQLQGLDEAGKKLLQAEAHDKFSLAVIGKFMDSKDYAGARTYFNNHLNEMTSETASKVDSVLQTKEAVSQGTSLAQELWADKSLSFEQKMIKTQDALKDNPDGMRIAQEQLRALWSAHMDAQRQLIGEAWDQISGLNPEVPRTSFAELKSSPLWQQLDGTAKMEFQKDYEVWCRRNDGVESKSDRLAQGMAYVDLVADEDKLARMTRQDILAKAGVLGPEKTVQLLAYQKQLLKGEAALQTAKMDRRIFNEVLDQCGYSVPGAKGFSGKDVDRDRYAQMDIDCRAAIARAQVARKGFLRDDEVADIIRRQVGAVTVKSWFGGKTVPFYKITDIKDIDAPEARKQTAVNVLKSQGKAVTPQAVLTTLQMMDMPGFLNYIYGGSAGAH